MQHDSKRDLLKAQFHRRCMSINNQIILVAGASLATLVAVSDCIASKMQNGTKAQWEDVSLTVSVALAAAIVAGVHGVSSICTNSVKEHKEDKEFDAEHSKPSAKPS